MGRVAFVDVVGYRVYRKIGAGGTWTLLNTTGEVSGTKYRDTPVTNGRCTSTT